MAKAFGELHSCHDVFFGFPLNMWHVGGFGIYAVIPVAPPSLSTN